MPPHSATGSATSARRTWPKPYCMQERLRDDGEHGVGDVFLAVLGVWPLVSAMLDTRSGDEQCRCKSGAVPPL